MIFVLILPLVSASAPEFSTNSPFFIEPSILNNSSILYKTNQLKGLQESISSYSKSLRSWGKSYHLFKVDIQTQILSDLLTHNGQNDFFKEVGRCEMADNVDTESVSEINEICASENQSNKFMKVLILSLQEKAENCVNVKEKFRVKIKNIEYQDHIMNSVLLDTELQEPSQNFLQNDDKPFESIFKKVEKNLPKICDDFAELSTNLLELQQQTLLTLSSLLN